LYNKKKEMKKFICLSILSLSALATFAQLTEGKVVYEEKVNIHKRMEGEAAKFKSMVPEYQTKSMVLYFNSKLALYKDNAADAETGGGFTRQDANGNEIEIKMDRPKNTVFTNLETKENIEQIDFMGRVFLVVDDEGEQPAWKMTSESKTILGYTCLKASYTSETDTVVAWFTPQIPLAAGPKNFGKLPGMILELDHNNGSGMFIATEIVDEKVGDNIIDKPKKGKKYTRKEFKALVDEKMKEMRSSGGMFRMETERR